MKIVIVGYGWMGQQLGPVLAADGHSLCVTRRSEHQMHALPEGVQGLVLDLGPALLVTDALLDSFHQAIVICAIAPGRGPQADYYATALAGLQSLMHQAGSAGVIHFSSSGIYEELNHDVDESVVLQQQLPRVQRLIAGEIALQQFQPCITLRLAGLMGPGRHPGQFANGKTLPNPDAPINMVHALDVIAAVKVLLAQKELSSAVYNLCCPQLVSRLSFYQQAARLTNSTITFNDKTTTQRRVSPLRFMQQFEFDYRFAAATDGLIYCD